MIRLQDIAEMTGVSRTTVSNVLHGKTKKVSPETMEKIRRVLEETSYEPNLASAVLTGKGSRIIGFVIGYETIHGYPATMDSFISALLAEVQEEAQRLGYCVMIIGGSREERVVEIASRWSIDGLLFIGYDERRYIQLRKKLNKKAVLIDTYTRQESYDYQNVGIDDYDGGYQVGQYLLRCGYPKALYMAEVTYVLPPEGSGKKSMPEVGLCNQKRWEGFQAAMGKAGYCSKHRFIVLNEDLMARKRQYETLLPRMLEAGAVAMAADYNAMELINYLSDRNVRVPDQISVIGFDDCIYAEYIRPRLTTVHQDIAEKGKTAVRRLLRMIDGEELPESHISGSVHLVVRDSVKVRTLVHRKKANPVQKE